MERCRIACVRYLNTVPLIHGLDRLEGVELIPAVPSRIAGMVRQGEADVGLCSIVDAVNGFPGLTLLPSGMIGCDGPTLTVRLFSAVPLEGVTAVHADSDSHTSVVLCRVLLKKLFGVTPSVVEFDARERVVRGGMGGDTPALESAWPETVLLIGDKVVTDAPPGDRYPYQMDLGEAWARATGLPFVYAMWMCLEGSEGSLGVRSAAAALDRTLRHNMTRLDWIVNRHAPEHRWPVELARKYLGEYLKYTVGPREREAVNLFLGEAAAMGLIEAGPARWADAVGTIAAGS